MASFALYDGRAALPESRGVRKRGLVAGLLFLSVMASASIQAEGNAANGAVKAALCATCHGANGISVNPLWPNLAGQQQVYLARQIRAFRDGERKEPTMTPFVGSLSDQDAEDLAAHFSGLKACPEYAHGLKAGVDTLSVSAILFTV